MGEQFDKEQFNEIKEFVKTIVTSDYNTAYELVSLFETIERHEVNSVIDDWCHYNLYSLKNFYISKLNELMLKAEQTNDRELIDSIIRELMESLNLHSWGHIFNDYYDHDNGNIKSDYVKYLTELYFYNLQVNSNFNISIFKDYLKKRDLENNVVVDNVRDYNSYIISLLNIHFQKFHSKINQELEQEQT